MMNQTPPQAQAIATRRPLMLRGRWIATDDVRIDQLTSDPERHLVLLVVRGRRHFARDPRPHSCRLSRRDERWVRLVRRDVRQRSSGIFERVLWRRINMPAGPVHLYDLELHIRLVFDRVGIGPYSEHGVLVTVVMREQAPCRRLADTLAGDDANRRRLASYDDDVCGFQVVEHCLLRSLLRGRLAGR